MSTIATTYQYINLGYLDTMTGGDAEMMRQMLDMIIEEIPDEVSKMQTCTVAQDWHEVFQISHKLKTTFAFIGNNDMTSLNKTIEHCARHTIDLDEIVKMVTQLSTLSIPVLAELKNVRF